ncbi:MAG: ABC transporter substrate-binding protein [Gammaproteobacteria bacterium]|nr:ABC transporter substrate-binding protein [Gammaproteobacteria bacterium]
MKYPIYIAILFFTSFHFAFADNKTEYTVGIIPYIPAGEFVVADHKKLYEKEGLNVRSIYYTSTGDWVRALSNGKLDFSGLWNATQVDMYYRGSSAKRLALMSYDSDDYKMVIRNNAKPEDLKGKRIAVFADYFGTHWFVHNFMHKSGASVHDVKLIEMNNLEGYKNFKNKRVDGLIFDGKYMDNAITEGDGMVAPIDRDMYLAATTGGPSYFETDRKITRDELKKFLRAWVKAMIWIEDDKNAEEYKQILTTAFSNNLELVGLETEQDYLKRKPRSMLIPMKNMVKLNKSMNTMFDKLNDIRKSIGYENNRKYMADKMFDNSIILEVLEELGYK